MPITLIFESHSTTFDNEAHLFSGWYDVELSPLGYQQCDELGERYKDAHLDAVYCSDLQRAYLTGEIAFKGRDIPIIRDARLRECDTGDLTQADATLVKSQNGLHIDTPFPNGESYAQTAVRMKAFLDETRAKHKDGDVIMVIGHRATQYGLEHWLNGVPLLDIATAPWKWQPGWTYQL